MDIWDGPSCNMINGTDSTIYAPFVTKQKVLRVFEAEVCRSIHLTYDRDVEAEGIPGYRFALPKDIFSEENPDNQCFCKETDKSNCPKSGVVSVGACKQGAPIFISNPYFLDADPSYAEPFGLQPNVTRHESYLILEPVIGIFFFLLIHSQLLKAFISLSICLVVFMSILSRTLSFTFVEKKSALLFR